ncbi:hypothetical protein [uncultured Psychrobacter sp.]|uniref:hypothetical protein n=1 Tax=uncultured Psychrobacter sp. TaxID=259303 RepID=UPI002638D76A|nr:hypothetical protein [uncultured Psychrobacter sp.]
MKTLTLFLFGLATGLFLRRFLSIPLWLEITIIAVIALLLWFLSSNKMFLKEKPESKE